MAATMKSNALIIAAVLVLAAIAIGVFGVR